jgi:hypothetical protein
MVWRKLGDVAMELPGMTATRRVEQNGEDFIVYVKPPAFFNQDEVAVHLTADQYKRYLLWRAGAGMIQDMLDDMSDDEREKLMSGLTDDNFNKAWGNDRTD